MSASARRSQLSAVEAQEAQLGLRRARAPRPRGPRPRRAPAARRSRPGSAGAGAAGRPAPRRPRAPAARPRGRRRRKRPTGVPEPKPVRVNRSGHAGRSATACTASSARRRAHPDPLRAAVVEGDARHDVAGGALEEDALAARHRAHRVAQRARVVRRVGDDLDARRDGVRAVPDDRRDGAAVLADRLQDGHADVGHAVGVPADAPHHAVGVALAAVHGLVRLAEPPADPGGLEPLAGQAADLDDAAVQVLDVGGRRGVGLHHALAEGAVHAQAAGRRVVGVVPVEQDARAGGTGRSLDAVAQGVDLGRLDGRACRRRR